MLENYPLIVKILFFFGGAFIVTYKLIPKIISVAHEKQLLVKPNNRSSHEIVTPAFGGVAFYITFIIMLSFLRNEFLIFNSNYVLVSASILFIVGLKDDLVSVSPRTKIIGQLLAILFILISGEFIVENLNGFLGIYQISPWIVMPILIFFMLGLINAYNLIDGADGLAAIVGLVMTMVFAYLFYQFDEIFYLLFTLIIMGIFAAFLPYNLSKNHNNKIFMGDTGSLFMGFMLVVLVFKLLTIPEIKMVNTSINISNIPIIVGGILFIPLFDTCRVSCVRFFNNQPIFNPDRNHIHHLLLDSGFSHLQTSIIIASISFIISFTIIQLSYFLNSFWMMGVVILLILTLFTFFHLLKLKIQTNKLSITATQ